MSSNPYGVLRVSWRKNDNNNINKRQYNKENYQLKMFN